MSLIFFFSSRRRHTRCSRDWSSDVCSSDLAGDLGWIRRITDHQGFAVRHPPVAVRALLVAEPVEKGIGGPGVVRNTVLEIGRASCRGRVEISGVGGSFKKKKKKNESE